MCFFRELLSKYLKLISKKTVVIILSVSVLGGVVGGGVLTTFVQNEKQSAERSYFTSSQADTFTEYVKTEAYSVIDGYVDEYTLQKKSSEFLSEADILSFIDSILSTTDNLNLTDVEKSALRAKIDSAVRDSLLELDCSCSLTELSKGYIVNKITDDLKDYITELDLSNYDSEGLSEKLNSSVSNVLSTYKDDIDISAYITNTDNDIKSQIVNKIELPVIIRDTVGVDVGESFVSNIIENINNSSNTLQVSNTKVSLSGSTYLTDDKISNITSVVSTQLSDSVSYSVDVINSSINDVETQMNALSTQYKNLQSQHAELVEKVSSLKNAQSGLTGSELANNISNINSANSEIETLETDIKNLETALDTYNTYLGDIKLVMNANYTTLSSQIDMSTYDSELGNIKYQLTTLIDNVKKSGIDSSAFENKINDYYNALEISIAALKDTKVDEDSFVTYKNDQIEALNTVYSQISALDEKTINDTDALNASIDKIKTSMNGYNASYNKDISLINEGISNLQSDIEDKVNNLSSDFQTKITDEVNTINDSFAINDEEIKNIKSNLSSLGDYLDSSKTELTNADENLSSNLNNLQISVNETASNTDSKITNINSNIDNLKDKIETDVNNLETSISTKADSSTVNQNASKLKSDMTAYVDAIKI